MSAKKCKFGVEELRYLLLKEEIPLPWVSDIIEAVMNSPFPLQSQILQIYYTFQFKPDSHVIPFSFVNGIPGLVRFRCGSRVFCP